MLELDINGETHCYVLPEGMKKRRCFFSEDMTQFLVHWTVET